MKSRESVYPPCNQTTHEWPRETPVPPKTDFSRDRLLRLIMRHLIDDTFCETRTCGVSNRPNVGSENTADDRDQRKYPPCRAKQAKRVHWIFNRRRSQSSN